MNKYNKVLLYVLAFIIFLAVASFSYAYFSVELSGNETARTISVTTGTLLLEYSEGNNEINGVHVVPGWNSGNKTIRAKNIGTLPATYEVVFQEINNTIMNGEAKIVGTCVSKYTNPSTNVTTVSGTCENIDLQSIPVTTNGYVLKSGIPIEPNYTHEYTINISFIETNDIQDYNQGKSLEGKLGINETRPWYETAASNPNRLTSKMLANGSQPNTAIASLNTKTTTQFMATLGETALYYTTDTEETQDGRRVYYYRGDTEENHVIFAGFCWRIVRTNEDGSVRLRYNGTPSSGTCPVSGSQIYASYVKNGNTISGENVPYNNTSYSGNQPNHLSSYSDLQNIKPVVPILDNPHDVRGKFMLPEEVGVNMSNKYVGYMYGSTCTSYETCHANEINSYIKNWVEDWYAHTIGSNENYDNKVIDSEFCNDRSVVSGTGVGSAETVYGALLRMHDGTPTYKCPQENDIFEEKVGLLTKDEILFTQTTNTISSTYLYTSNAYWTMTPSNRNNSGYIYIYTYTTLDYSTGRLDMGHSVLPVISLKANIEVSSGLGTNSSPWIIN